jgi:hypothetical protein
LQAENPFAKIDADRAIKPHKSTDVFTLRGTTKRRNQLYEESVVQTGAF